MHEIAHPITKSELLPGDCMLHASEHVCLFGGWLDKDKTHCISPLLIFSF